MATTIFDWQFIQDVASGLPDGQYALTATQVAFLLATIENKSTFRGNWLVGGVEPTDTEWDLISAFIADTERAIMVGGMALQAGFRVFKSGQQTLNSDAYTKVSWENEDFDVQGDFDFSNNRFVCSVEGKYFFSVLARISSAAYHGTSLALNFELNGSQISRASTEAPPFGQSCFVYVLVADVEIGDYLEVHAKQDAPVALPLWAGIHTQFSGFFVGN